jgi:hypothetical protein
MRGVALLVVAAVAVAHASPADELFQRGRDKLKAGDYAGACEAFEASLRLDHAYGTLFNLGDCDDKLGKLAKALAVYREVAAGDTNAERRAKAAELADAIAARVPHLALALASTPAGTVATVDGVAFDPASELPLDLGAHELLVQAPGYADVRQSITVKERETVRVPLTLVRDAAKPNPIPAQPAPTSSRKHTATIVLATGGAVTLGGLVLGTITYFEWRDVQTQADADTAACRLGCLDRAARQRALDDRTSSVETLGDVSTLTVGLGVAVLAAGTFLWVTAPKPDEVHVAPSVGPGQAGLTVVGRF